MRSKQKKYYTSLLSNHIAMIIDHKLKVNCYTEDKLLNGVSSKAHLTHFICSTCTLGIHKNKFIPGCTSSVNKSILYHFFKKDSRKEIFTNAAQNFFFPENSISCKSCQKITLLTDHK